MSRQRGGIFVVSLGLLVVGTLAYLLYFDSASQTRGGGARLNRKGDPLRPPKPEWNAVPKNATNGMNVENNDDSASRDESSLITTAMQPKPSLENPPQKEQIREQVRKNPHATPKALLAFAEELANSMQGAFSDRETRYTVSRQLITCARDSTAKGSAQAARALCLYNLERLNQRFPDELMASYQSLIAELPEDLIFVSGVSKNSAGKTK